MTTTKFTDAAGREWDLRLSVPALLRCEAECGVKIGGNFTNLGKLLSEPEQAVNCLAAVLRPQLTKAGISDADFGESLAGSVFATAVDAFVEAIFQFLPANKSAPLRAAFRKFSDAEGLYAEELTRHIEALDVVSLLKPAAV